MTGGGGVGGGFRLVADEHIDVREELLELDLEELRDERGGKVQDDRLAVRAGSLGDLHGGLETVREEVTLDVDELCARDELGDLRGLEVGGGEFLSGTQGGAERSVVAGDDDGAGSGLGRGRLDLVG